MTTGQWVSSVLPSSSALVGYSQTIYSAHLGVTIDRELTSPPVPGGH